VEVNVATAVLNQHTDNSNKRLFVFGKMSASLPVANSSLIDFPCLSGAAPAVRPIGDSIKWQIRELE
jgi:hypothetical protein